MRVSFDAENGSEQGFSRRSFARGMLQVAQVGAEVPEQQQIVRFVVQQIEIWESGNTIIR